VLAIGESFGRQLLLDRLVTAISARLDPLDCCLVGVDGVDGAGKTTFADAFGQPARARGRPVVCLSLDDFHAQRAVRYRLGRESPAGFWLDSYDYDAFGRDVLTGLRPGGNRKFRRASLDLETDELLEPPWETAPGSALVIVDGLFLHRDELAGVWAFSVFLEVPFDLTAERMAARDGSSWRLDDPRLARCVEGQRLYFAACRPWE
jgi:uridine kinase